MPNRVIKESLKRSPQIDSLTWFEEVVFYRLIVTVDDYGRYYGNPIILRNDLFPTKENITKRSIEDALRRLEANNLLVRYTVDGTEYVQLTTWSKHQRVRDSVERFPSPQLAATRGDLPQKGAENPNPNPNPNPEIQQQPQKRACAEPDHTTVWKYMMGKGIDTAWNEATVFIAYNAKRGWDCLPNWQLSADLWCARHLERQKGADR